MNGITSLVNTFISAFHFACLEHLHVQLDLYAVKMSKRSKQKNGRSKSRRRMLPLDVAARQRAEAAQEAGITDSTGNDLAVCLLYAEKAVWQER